MMVRLDYPSASITHVFYNNGNKIMYHHLIFQDFLTTRFLQDETTKY